jgi:hypothetical protein
MKRYVFFTAVLIILGRFGLFTQETDNVPYLSDEDILSLEIILPDDVPNQTVLAETEPGDGKINRNEISRLNPSKSLYHLIILDRTSCASDSDISGIDESAVLYKFKHLEKGYLIVLYKTPNEGPVFPIFPENSYIIIDLMTNRINTIGEYVNSAAFNKFVTSRGILEEILEMLKNESLKQP